MLNTDEDMMMEANMYMNDDEYDDNPSRGLLDSSMGWGSGNGYSEFSQGGDDSTFEHTTMLTPNEISSQLQNNIADVGLANHLFIYFSFSFCEC